MFLVYGLYAPQFLILQFLGNYHLLDLWLVGLRILLLDDVIEAIESLGGVEKTRFSLAGLQSLLQIFYNV